MKRSAQINRKTTETDIKIVLHLDGSGKSNAATPVSFLNHMLDLTARHGLFDITVSARGDVEVDFHHTVEDIGICLGQALLKALGDKGRIRRYGEATIPMDEALSRVVIDISGRPLLVMKSVPLRGKTGDFDLALVEEFFQAFVNHAGITMHMDVIRGRNAHHVVESLFKAFSRALSSAVAIDSRGRGIPSTKGIL